MTAARNQSQLNKFKETAREIEADEDADRFEAALKKIVEYKPKKGEKKG